MQGHQLEREGSRNVHKRDDEAIELKSLHVCATAMRVWKSNLENTFVRSSLARRLFRFGDEVDEEEKGGVDDVDEAFDNDDRVEVVIAEDDCLRRRCADVKALVVLGEETRARVFAGERRPARECPLTLATLDASFGLRWWCLEDKEGDDGADDVSTSRLSRFDGDAILT